MPQQVPQYQPLSRINFGLLIVRVTTALIFFMHGYQRLFDAGYSATRNEFDALGVPVPAVTTVVVITLELVGGFLLFSGIYTRFVGLLFGLLMLGAIIFDHFDHGFFVANNGFEFTLLLLAVSVAFIVAGGGQYSADRAFNLPYSEDWQTLFSQERD